MSLNMTIEETHETDAHKKSGTTARTAKRKVNREAPTEFVAVDGEGITGKCLNCGLCGHFNNSASNTDDDTCACGHHRSGHKHLYVMLGIGDQQITDPNGLDHNRVFGFLWKNRKRGKKVAYVGFFLGYDFTQWLKTISAHEATMLLLTEGKAKRKRKDRNPVPFPVYVGDYDSCQWEIDILGSKRFKFRPGNANPLRDEKTPWMYVCDTGPFFQKSFLKVIDPAEWSEPIVTPEEYAIIAEGKSKRASAQLDDEMGYYNKLENAILPRVLTQLDKGFASLGVHLKPEQWYGPGQAAQAWLTGRAITSEQLQATLPRTFLNLARDSYFGGWFELMAHGIIPGTTYEYDINSAYPYIISSLPCLEHGKYTTGTGIPTDYRPGDICYVRASVRTPARNKLIGAMPHRSETGRISRPRETSGVYLWEEIQAGIAAGVILAHSVKVTEWKSLRPCDCPPPLAEVKDIYAMRKRVGKKTPLGIACKLVPNSLYGKFAQSVGSPKFANPVYASLITARCRIQILNAIATHPNGFRDVLMIATDGIYFRTSHPTLSISGELGDWECEEKQNICLFKPGVYWDDETRAQIARGEAPVFKARGVNARDFGRVLSDVDAEFQRISRLGTTDTWRWPKVTFPIGFAMVTATQAAMWNNWETAGYYVSRDPDAAPIGRQNSDPIFKRYGCWIDRDILRTYAKQKEDSPSVPYDKKFGMEDPFSDESRDVHGETPDGYPGILVKEALGQ
jgi:DNA polymerase type B, organellar and viral